MLEYSISKIRGKFFEARLQLRFRRFLAWVKIYAVLNWAMVRRSARAMQLASDVIARSRLPRADRIKADIYLSCVPLSQVELRKILLGEFERKR